MGLRLHIEERKEGRASEALQAKGRFAPFMASFQLADGDTSPMPPAALPGADIFRRERVKVFLPPSGCFFNHPNLYLKGVQGGIPLARRESPDCLW
jgi:hypothetical protein